MKYNKSVIAFTASLFFSCSLMADPLSDAAKFQSKTANEESELLKVEDLQEQAKNIFNSHLQSLFFKYYNEVKKSEIKLTNAKQVVNDLNASRRRSGGCCDILLSSSKDNDMYLITVDGDGLFAIDGYGLQSVNGEIHDSQFDKAGTISNQCKYEVFISYKNSRTYNCSEFTSGKIDDKVIRDMMEMLPVAMKNYFR